MKYLTRNLARGLLTEDEETIALVQYENRLKEIWSDLPDAVKVLSSRSLHDGIIESMAYNRGDQTLELGLIAGDLQVGYRLFKLTYFDIDLSPQTNDILVSAKSKDLIEILYDEWDTVDREFFAHRLLFHPKFEVELLFKNLIMEEFFRPDRQRRTD